MPNLTYMFVTFAYHLALAVWIGGAIALGALTAPELFRQLPRGQAGGIFGPILRRFARLRLAAIVVALAAALTKHFAWETHAASVWMAARWAALTFLALAVVYEIFSLEPAMARHRSSMTGDAPDEASRSAFMRLHRRSEALMNVSLFAALVAVLLG